MTRANNTADTHRSVALAAECQHPSTRKRRCSRRPAATQALNGNGKLSKSKPGTKTARTLMGKLAGVPRCCSVYVTPADLETTQIKGAVDTCNGFSQHVRLQKLSSLLAWGKKCEKRIAGCSGCSENRKGISYELLELTATRNKQDKHRWVNRASNMMKAWPWSWAVTYRLTHVRVKIWTTREENAEGQPARCLTLPAEAGQLHKLLLKY